MAAAISRRSWLAAMGVGLGAALAACDSTSTPEAVQTLTPGPRQPGPQSPDQPEPAPSQAADSGVLLLALARAQHHAATSRAITGAEGWHRTLHQQVQASFDEQVRVLEELLRAGNVPVPTLSPPVTDSATRTSGPEDAGRATATGESDRVSSTGDAGDAATATGPSGDQSSSTGDASETTASPADQAMAQLSGLGRSCLEDVTPAVLETISAVSAPNLPVLVAIAGQRGATAALFGSPPEWAPLSAPAGVAAAGLLDSYRPAVYGFEVLAARSRGDERTAYEQALAPLRRVTRQLTQLAGEAASPAPLGYGLPGPLESTSSRGQLAGSLSAVLPPTIMGPTRGFVADVAAVAGSVQLLAEAVRLGQPWNPVTGFPGMQVPGA